MKVRERCSISIVIASSQNVRFISCCFCFVIVVASNCRMATKLHLQQRLEILKGYAGVRSSRDIPAFDVSPRRCIRCLSLILVGGGRGDNVMMSWMCAVGWHVWSWSLCTFTYRQDETNHDCDVVHRSKVERTGISYCKYFSFASGHTRIVLFLSNLCSWAMRTIHIHTYLPGDSYREVQVYCKSWGWSNHSPRCFLPEYGTGIDCLSEHCKFFP